MSISSTVRKAGPCIGNGSAATFSFGFKVFTSADLSVLLLNPNGIQSTLALTTDYTVALNPNQDSNPGGSITLTAGVLASGYSLVVTTAIPELQGVELQNLGAFFPGVINDALDRLTILNQQLQEQIDRCLKFPETDSTSPALASKILRAGTLLGFDSNGLPGAMSTLPVGAIISNGILQVNGAQFKGAPTYDVTAYGAVCDGSTDDTAAVQSALNACAVTGGVLQFPYGICYIAGTVSHTHPTNVWIRGAGTTLKGLAAAASAGPILRLGDSTGVLTTTNLVISGISVTNGAWNSSNGAIIAGQSTQDAIQVYCTKLSSFDIVGINVGGAALFLGGNLGALNAAEWNHVRIRAFDVGIGLSGFYHSVGGYDVQVRRAHSNGVLLYNAADIGLNVTVDECLHNQAAPGTFDGVGVFLRDFDWGTVEGRSGICYSEALKLYGNSRWNTISGNFYDSSTSANGATSNITLVSDGTNSPTNNRFNVYAGWTGTASSNKPAYGLNQVNGSINAIAGFDATGVLNSPGYTGTNLQVGFNWQGSTGTAIYYNPTNVRTELHGLNSLKFDIDTDTTAGGTPVFVVSSRNGTANLINAVLGSGTTFDTSVNVKGGTSGTTNLIAQGVASGTLSLPAATDTLVGKATTDILTNKALGTNGTVIQKFAKYTATLSPVAVAANTTAEQIFTVTGVAVGDTVVGVSKTTAQAGLGIVGWRANGANSVGITFINATGSPITPTASEVYAFEVIQ